MIPLFPTFKKIDIEDRKIIESYTNQYQPYSDFNFISLWAWNITGERKISMLNGNLVVRFTDYKTCEYFYSFLGTNEPKRTISELIKFARTTGVSPVLRFVPEESVSDLLESDFLIEEDEDNFDYIFSISQLASMDGPKLKEKRSLANRFLRENPDAVFELREINDPVTHEQIFSLIHRWAKKKELDNKKYDIENEEKAISRLLKVAGGKKLFISCVLLHGTMIGFSIDEILPKKYALSHFFKADISYIGIYDFLNKCVSQYLKTKDIVLWNWEQDLGLKNIRNSKKKYHPINFLKKYKVQ